MIKTFLFDLGNVLVDFSHDQMCRQMGEVCHVSPDQMKAFLFGDDYHLEFERGRVSAEEFHRGIEQHFATSIEAETLRVASADIFTVKPDMLAVLRSLRSQSFRLVMLSNTNSLHFEHIRNNFDLVKYFDDFVLSYEVGAAKPEPDIYQAALTKIACEPAGCFYTDDIPDYVAAAREFGLQAEVFTDSEQFIAHLAERGVQV